MAKLRHDWFTILGNPSLHDDVIREEARSHGRPEWTVHSQARPHDRVAFYLTAPTSAIVATGTVASTPRLQSRKKEDWHGKYLAEIHSIQLAATPLKRDRLLECFPSWGWPRQPRMSARVPDELVDRFERELAATSRSRNASRMESDIEGALREVRTLQRRRSRRLRDRALDESDGSCAACGNDFSRLAGGIGLRVLQVHHIRPLAAARDRRPTHLKDLAVVCANCHLMLHAERDTVMPIQALKKLLRLAVDQPS